MQERKPKRKSQDIPNELWEKIRIEYVSTDLGYRKIAEKYGVSYSKVQKMGMKDKWIKDKMAYNSSVADKSLEILSDSQADRIVRAIRIGDRMLEKVEESLSQLDVNDRTGLRQLSGVLKDLKEIGIFRSELDRREQEARIAKLQKETEEEVQDTTIRVVIDDSVDEFGE